MATDGTWELNINVTDLAVDKTLRVSGDLHMGGVMVKLVEALGMLFYSILCTLLLIKRN